MYDVTKEKWGFLREHSTAKDINGLDKDTGLHRTGLDKYLEVIFPNENWIHDKGFESDGKKYRIRPDYRCDNKKLIIEFDGVQHFTKPDRIMQDDINQKIYEDNGFTVIRIPYFIQLTNDVVKKLFGVTINEKLFNPEIPSLGAFGENSPAYLCPAGLKRMARIYKQFPQQYKVNIEALKAVNNGYLTGVGLLEEEYNRLP